MRDLKDTAEATAGSLSSVFEAETAARSKNVTANRLGGATYDKQGFATDSTGARITAGGQLTPPNAWEDWEFVQSTDYRAYQLADSAALVVPGVGYWRRKGREAGGSASLAGSAAASQPTTTPTTTPPVYTVNVNLAGRQTTINTASAADQTALTGLLRDLETAAGRG
jgi:hypothetical protein